MEIELTVTRRCRSLPCTLKNRVEQRHLLDRLGFQFGRAAEVAVRFAADRGNPGVARDRQRSFLGGQDQS